VSTKIKTRRPNITSKKVPPLPVLRALAECLPFFPTVRVETNGGTDDAPARGASVAEQRRRQQQQEIEELTNRCERPPSHLISLSMQSDTLPSDIRKLGP
jgi:hypothetical protein